MFGNFKICFTEIHSMCEIEKFHYNIHRIENKLLEISKYLLQKFVPYEKKNVNPRNFIPFDVLQKFIPCVRLEI